MKVSHCAIGDFMSKTIAFILLQRAPALYLYPYTATKTIFVDFAKLCSLVMSTRPLFDKGLLCFETFRYS